MKLPEDVHEARMTVTVLDEVPADLPQEPETKRASDTSTMTAKEMAVTTVGSFAIAAAVLQWVLPMCVIC